MKTVVTKTQRAVRTIALLLITVVTTFCAIGCGGQEQSKTDEQISDLSSQIEQLDGTISGLRSLIDEQNEKIEELEKDLDMVATRGTFYTMQEAYDNGWLTKEDLMACCYYRCGEVWEGDDSDSDNWTKSNYVPQQGLTELDKKIEARIKSTYYILNKWKFYNREGEKLGGTDDLTVRYFGTYNNSHVVIVECSLWAYGAADNPITVGGVCWWQNPEDFVVFKP